MNYNRKENIAICPQCEQENTLVEDGLCFNCNCLNLKWDIESGAIKITEDNVSEHYKFMNAKQISDNRTIIHYGFNKRSPLELEDLLGIKGKELEKNWEYNCFQDGRVNKQSYFGIKDTLKPIDEYIAEIKATDEYKEYMIGSFIEEVFIERLEQLKNIGIGFKQLNNNNWDDIKAFNNFEDDKDEYRYIKLYDDDLKIEAVGRY